MLGVWETETQSDKPLTVSSDLIREICAYDHKCKLEEVRVLGWFEVDTDSPDRQFGDTIYVQAVELEYRIPDEEWENLKDLSMFKGWEHKRTEARALYGITDNGKVHIWAD